MGAQYLAYRFAYHPNLGPSLFAIPTTLRRYVLMAACGCFGAAVFFLLRRGQRGLAAPFATTAGALVPLSLGPLYSPFQFLRWAIAYRQASELASIVSDGILVVAGSTIAAAASMLMVLGSRGERKVSSSHG